MAHKKKLLLISLGSIGQRHLRNSREMLPDAEIALYRQHTPANGITPEHVDVVFDNFNTAIAYQPDAVIISSPASEHVRCAEPFLQQGAHIFLEKPLSDSSSNITPLQEAASSSSSFLMIGYVLRFLPALHTLRHMIADGRFGKVLSANVEVGQYLPDWRPNSDYRTGVSAQKALGGGALLELSHELDYAVWLFGRPDHLQCSAAKLSDLDIDVEDSAHVIFEYGKTRNEKRVVVQVDFLQRVANMYVEIVAAQGTLKADLIKETLTLYTPETPDGEVLNTPKLATGNEIYLRQFDFFFSKAFADYIPQFAETSNFDQWATLDQSCAIMKLVDLAKTANDLGQRQTVED